MKPKIFYSIGSKIGGQGLALVAQKAGEILEKKSMLEQLVCYGTKKNVNLNLINKIYFQPSKIFSFLPSKYYYSLKREWIDIRSSQYLRKSNANIFHGWTHECLRSIRVAKNKGMITILERGNPHPNYVKMMHDEEAHLYKRTSNFDYSNENFFLKRFNHCRYEMNEALKEINEADYIFVNSTFCAKTYITNGVNKNKIIIIPRGYAPSHFKPRSIQKKGDKFILLFVGQLMMRKGVKYLIDAWADLCLDNAELWFVGGITKEMSDILQEKKKLNRIKFFGHVSDPSPYYQKASAFILPSLDEGSAKVTYESMAVGLPCIFTVNTGTLATEDNAIIIKSKSKNAIKKSILSLYKNVELRNSLGAKARNYIKKYTWANYQKNLIDQYKIILNSK